MTRENTIGHPQAKLLPDWLISLASVDNLILLKYFDFFSNNLFSNIQMFQKNILKQLLLKQVIGVWPTECDHWGF
jgi:hypothetical protein